MNNNDNTMRTPSSSGTSSGSLIPTDDSGLPASSSSSNNTQFPGVYNSDETELYPDDISEEDLDTIEPQPSLIEPQPSLIEPQPSLTVPLNQGLPNYNIEAASQGLIGIQLDLMHNKQDKDQIINIYQKLRARYIRKVEGVREQVVRGELLPDSNDIPTIISILANPHIKLFAVPKTYSSESFHESLFDESPLEVLHEDRKDQQLLVKYFYGGDLVKYYQDLNHKAQDRIDNLDAMKKQRDIVEGVFQQRMSDSSKFWVPTDPTAHKDTWILGQIADIQSDWNLYNAQGAGSDALALKRRIEKKLAVPPSPNRNGVILSGGQKFLHFIKFLVQGGDITEHANTNNWGNTRRALLGFVPGFTARFNAKFLPKSKVGRFFVLGLLYSLKTIGKTALIVAAVTIVGVAIGGPWGIAICAGVGLILASLQLSKAIANYRRVKNKDLTTPVNIDSKLRTRQKSIESNLTAVQEEQNKIMVELNRSLASLSSIPPTNTVIPSSDLSQNPGISYSNLGSDYDTSGHDTSSHDTSGHVIPNTYNDIHKPDSSFNDHGRITGDDRTSQHYSPLSDNTTANQYNNNANRNIFPSTEHQPDFSDLSGPSSQVDVYKINSPSSSTHVLTNDEAKEGAHSQEQLRPFKERPGVKISLKPDTSIVH